MSALTKAKMSAFHKAGLLMSNGVITMSQKELDRVTILEQLKSKQISQKIAATQMGVSTRQVRRLQHRYAQEGAIGLASKHRGKPAHNRLVPEDIAKAVGLIKERYYDFGPTLAHEKLVEQHEMRLSVESIRQIMIKEGFWRGKKRKAIHIHQQRPRRSCLGELSQIDGSEHDWFEGRREKCCLIVMIDDATSQLMWLHFAEAETTDAYFTCVEKYIKHHGRPVCFYSDRHSIFRVNIKEAKSGSGETQFGRAMRELGIETICANSSQAKGRVEKANGTLQDRLIKEMRLKGISDLPAANAFLPEFIADYNKRFAVMPANKINAHRMDIPNEETLQLIFSEHHQRKVSKNLEVSYNNVIYQIQTNNPSYSMRKSIITVCDRRGEITLLYKGKSLPYKRFDKNNKPAKIVTSKELNKNKNYTPNKPKATHPWKDQSFKIRQDRVSI